MKRLAALLADKKTSNLLYALGIWIILGVILWNAMF